MSDTDWVHVYRRSTGERLRHPVARADLRYNPDLAEVPSERDRVHTDPTPYVDDPLDDAAHHTSPTPGEQTRTTTTDDPLTGSDIEKG